MSDSIIRLEHVTKTVPRVLTKLSFRTEGINLIKHLTSRGHEGDNTPRDHVVLLRDISFDIKRGEKVGIVGTNGAGKTTLLRLISGIGKPSDGILCVEEPVVAILGLNAGFDNYRTGYENLYLNAAFHRIPHRRIKELEATIIEFSELGDAIYQPINTYSTGMTARLGISVAFHIMSNIVILDEVMAVGDIGFRQKCMERIQDMSVNPDTTLLLVSHSTDEVQNLCQRVIWLHKGEIMMMGETETIIKAYQDSIGGGIS